MQNAYFSPMGVVIDGMKSDLQSYKFIGGFEEDGNVNLWHRVDGDRKIITVPNVPRYFCFDKTKFGNLSKEIWNGWKAAGYYTNGVFIGDYGYIFHAGKLYKNDFDNWLTTLDDNGITPLEGDISRVQRLMLDLQLFVASPNDEEHPKVAFYDIETDDRKQKIVVGAERILSVAWKDQDTGEEQFLVLEEDSDKAERKMLQEVYKGLVKYDVLVGYNNYAFDDEYLALRFKKYEFDTAKWRRIETLDIFNLFERQGTFRKYDIRNRKLDTIAQAVLGENKVPFTGGVFDLWSSNKSLLQEYNMQDVRLIYKMEQILNSVKLVLNVCSISGLLHSIGYSPAKCVDSFILRNGVERRISGIQDFRYPTQYFRPEQKLNKYNPFSRNALAADKRKGRKAILEEEFGIDDYEEVDGALVLDAVPGLYKKVYFSDFNSLYPNVIRCFNLGLDTMLSESDKPTLGPDVEICLAPNGVYYRTDIVSSMSRCVEVLIEERAKIRGLLKNEDNSIKKQSLDVQQNAVKELTNSFFGVTAQWGGRYYKKELAESITHSGRTFLPFAVEWYNARGFSVVAGDTDSVAVSYDNKTESPYEMTQKFIEDLRTMIIREYNAYRSEVLKMSVEKAFAPMLILKKKNYAGWMTMKDGIDYKPDKPTIVGLQVKKGNNSRWATNICMSILRDLLSGEYLNSDHYMRLLKDEKDKLAQGKIPVKQLMIAARLGKDVDDYVAKRPLVHVRIAQRLIESGKLIPTYSTINYIMTCGFPTDGLDDTEITADSEIDVVWYYNTHLLQQVASYLDVVFPEVKWEDELAFPKNSKRSPFVLKTKVNLEE